MDADRKTLVNRVTARQGDASDADAEVVEHQLKSEIGPLDWTRVDARRPAAEIAEEIARRVAEIA